MRSLIKVYKVTKLLFAGVVFLSAFLLFQVQPLIGKYFLPFFGGASAVWMTTLFFFQVLLLLGYIYAQRISCVPLKRQVRIHLFLLCFICCSVCCLFFLWGTPITPKVTSNTFKSLSPLLRVLLLLTVSTGLPYFLLATTSSLIQHWYTKCFEHESPYYLYALSNVGSLLGLLTYPFIFEPFLDVYMQALIWSIAFFIYALGMGLLSLSMQKYTFHDEEESLTQCATASEYTVWISLPFLGSLLLLSTTNKLTQGVASLPFLWIVPLTAYLLSFIVSFSGKAGYKRKLYALLFVLFTAGVLCIEHFDYRIPFQTQIVIYAAFLFCGAMLMHGELYRLRPRKEKLTSFYLSLSIGGALGGFFVICVAPFLFKGYEEFSLCTALAIMLAVRILVSEIAPREQRGNGLVKQWFPGVLIGLVVLAVTFVIGTEGGVSLKKVRNFYGVLDIREYASSKIGPFRTMHHGLIKHGIQYQQPAYRNYPTAYFGPPSGVGTAILRHPKVAQKKPLRIGVIGLGVGTLAAYGRPGDELIYYELDPVVHTLAEEFFTYLSSCKAKVTHHYGDGRQVLFEQKQAGEYKEFDLFILDAFTGGTIPIHLITKEAFQLYDHHLEQTTGILAMNITNKYLNIVPQIKSLASALGYTFVIIETEADGSLNFDATWAILTKNKNFLTDNFVILTQNEDIEGCPLWTDAYSNILDLLK